MAIRRRRRTRERRRRRNIRIPEGDFLPEANLFHGMEVQLRALVLFWAFLNFFVYQNIINPVTLSRNRRRQLRRSSTCLSRHDQNCLEGVFCARSSTPLFSGGVENWKRVTTTFKGSCEKNIEEGILRGLLMSMSKVTELKVFCYTFFSFTPSAFRNRLRTKIHLSELIFILKGSKLYCIYFLDHFKHIKIHLLRNYCNCQFPHWLDFASQWVRVAKLIEPDLAHLDLLNLEC